VVGASGLVGSEVVRSAPSDWVTLGVARHVDGFATETLDLLDAPSVHRTIDAFQPDLVVVASAWPWVDGCERDPERSRRENVETVENLVHALEGAKARVVFFSTEHVFDGRADAYDEKAQPNPLSIYARHKRDVEELLLARGACLIARTSYVFGLEARRKNFMYRVVDAAKTRTPLKVPTKQAGLPTWSTWLASSALTLVNEGLEGVVHLAGPEVLTKGEWALAIAEALALEGVEILEVPWQESGQVAPRPERVRLINTRHELIHPPLGVVLRDIASKVC
jgi:dTDP-4-dehydrorhamnose reductase